MIHSIQNEIQHATYRKHSVILQDLLHDKDFNRKVLVTALPITIQTLMTALVAAADAIMLGRVGQDAMAAVSLATQISFVQTMILMGIISGVGVLGAQYWGKKDKVMMGRIFGLSVRESIFVSVLFFVGCYFFPRPLMKLFAGDEILIDMGAEYLKTASWSYLIVGISQSFLAIMRVSDHVKCSAWIGSVAVIGNIVLNAIFIFGLCGAPAMGVRGAAFATVLARVIELLCCAVMSMQRGYLHLKVKNVYTFYGTLIYDFWRYTLPILGAAMLWGIGFTTYTAIMGHLGRDAAAANSIAAVVRDLLCCLSTGGAGGIGIIIGNELGAGNLERGKQFGDRAMALSYLLGLFCTVMILLSIVPATMVADLTPEAEHYLVQMFCVLSVYMIGRNVCTIVINGIFSAGGDTIFDTYSLSVCMWCIALPCAFAGAFLLHLPVWMVYACTCLDEVGKIPWVMHHYRKYKWVKNITREQL